MAWLFSLFFISGFCSLLYELVWLRLAMAQFGVTTAMVSTVLSMFMGGLGLGSWAGGRLTRNWHGAVHPLRFYAFAEIMVGISGLVVPLELVWGAHLLHRFGSDSSFAYYLLSGAWVALSIVPWCACMGATIPLAMLSIRLRPQNEGTRSFSFLYLANVLGATAGATLPLLLIEGFGFRHTLWFSACLNFMLGAAAVFLAHKSPVAHQTAVPEVYGTTACATGSRSPLILLFATGLSSMALEVVWIRQFTPYLGTVVYAFAAILGFYLLMTLMGSRRYRKNAQRGVPVSRSLWAALGLAVLLPLFTTNPMLPIFPAYRLILGIGPFTALLGFLTPMLVDRWSGGDPERAGSAYAVNVAGCILGPLLAGFVLLPVLNERWVTMVFALPWFAVGLWSHASRGKDRGTPAVRRVAFAAVLIAAAFLSKGFEDSFPHRVVRRDHTATVIATGDGMNRRLYVNGVGMTGLTPITKMMAHMPMALLDHPPQNAMVICFGMGTTFRSLMSWHVPVTAVELVPSVPGLVGYFHKDGPELLRSPHAHVVIDDGRRFLQRTQDQYDVIVVDPPPPVEAAASSLLYSEEFYTAVKRRLRTGGILQQWLADTRDPVTVASMARALTNSFPYVRVFGSIEGWGYHFIASSSPIPVRSAEELAERMPVEAQRDLLEWGPARNAREQLNGVSGRELSIKTLEAMNAPPLQDDRPINEYYAMRSIGMQHAAAKTFLIHR